MIKSAFGCLLLFFSLLVCHGPAMSLSQETLSAPSAWQTRDNYELWLDSAQIWQIGDDALLVYDHRRFIYFNLEDLSSRAFLARDVLVDQDAWAQFADGLGLWSDPTRELIGFMQKDLGFKTWSVDYPPVGYDHLQEFADHNGLDLEKFDLPQEPHSAQTVHTQVPIARLSVKSSKPISLLWPSEGLKTEESQSLVLPTLNDLKSAHLPLHTLLQRIRSMDSNPALLNRQEQLLWDFEQQMNDQSTSGFLNWQKSLFDWSIERIQQALQQKWKEYDRLSYQTDKLERMRLMADYLRSSQDGIAGLSGWQKAEQVGFSKPKGAQESLQETYVVPAVKGHVSPMISMMLASGLVQFVPEEDSVLVLKELDGQLDPVSATEYDQYSVEEFNHRFVVIPNLRLTGSPDSLVVMGNMIQGGLDSDMLVFLMAWLMQEYQADLSADQRRLLWLLGPNEWELIQGNDSRYDGQRAESVGRLLQYALAKNWMSLSTVRSSVLYAHGLLDGDFAQALHDLIKQPPYASVFQQTEFPLNELKRVLLKIVKDRSLSNRELLLLSDCLNDLCVLELDVQLNLNFGFGSPKSPLFIPAHGAKVSKQLNMVIQGNSPDEPVQRLADFSKVAMLSADPQHLTEYPARAYWPSAPFKAPVLRLDGKSIYISEQLEALPSSLSFMMSPSRKGDAQSLIVMPFSPHDSEDDGTGLPNFTEISKLSSLLSGGSHQSSLSTGSEPTEGSSDSDNHINVPQQRFPEASEPTNIFVPQLAQDLQTAGWIRQHPQAFVTVYDFNGVPLNVFGSQVQQEDPSMPSFPAFSWKSPEYEDGQQEYPLVPNHHSYGSKDVTWWRWMLHQYSDDDQQVVNRLEQNFSSQDVWVYGSRLLYERQGRLHCFDSDAWQLLSSDSLPKFSEYGFLSWQLSHSLGLPFPILAFKKGAHQWDLSIGAVNPNWKMRKSSFNRQQLLQAINDMNEFKSEVGAHQTQIALLAWLKALHKQSAQVLRETNRKNELLKLILLAKINHLQSIIDRKKLSRQSQNHRARPDVLGQRTPRQTDSNHGTETKLIQLELDRSLTLSALIAKLDQLGVITPRQESAWISVKPVLNRLRRVKQPGLGAWKLPHVQFDRSFGSGQQKVVLKIGEPVSADILRMLAWLLEQQKSQKPESVHFAVLMSGKTAKSVPPRIKDVFLAGGLAFAERLSPKFLKSMGFAKESLWQEALVQEGMDLEQSHIDRVEKWLAGHGLTDKAA